MILTQFYLRKNSFHYFQCLALLRLPQKVKFTKNIKPVNLPKRCKSPVGLDVVAVGHGKTSDNGGVSLQLNYIQLKTVPLKQCSTLFPIFSFYDTYVCAQSENYGYQSVCNGDSGGPLISLKDNTLIGVADFVVIGEFSVDYSSNLMRKFFILIII